MKKHEKKLQTNQPGCCMSRRKQAKKRIFGKNS